MSRDAKIGAGILLAAAAVAVFIWVTAPREVEEPTTPFPQAETVQPTTTPPPTTGEVTIGETTETIPEVVEEEAATTQPAQEPPVEESAEEPPPAETGIVSVETPGGTEHEGETPAEEVPAETQLTEEKPLGMLAETPTVVEEPPAEETETVPGAAEEEPPVVEETQLAVVEEKVEKAEEAKPIELVEAPPSARSQRVYVVKKGDTLYKIAKRELGSPSLVDLIVEMNKDIIRNKDIIVPGTRLILPEVPKKEALPLPAGRTYTVRKGDTFWSISRQFYGKASDWYIVYEANRNRLGLKAPRELKPGMVLVIPERQ